MGSPVVVEALSESGFGTGAGDLVEPETFGCAGLGTLPIVQSGLGTVDFLTCYEGVCSKRRVLGEVLVFW